MMNNNSTTPFSSSREAKSSKFKFGRVWLVAIFIGLTSVYLLIGNILGKIGLGLIEIFTMVIFVPVLAYLIAAFINRISGSWGQGDLGQFTQAGGSVDSWTNSMAGTAEWVSLLFIITLISALSMTNHDAIAIISGVFCGFAIASILIIPKLTNQAPLTLSKIISSQFSNSNSNSTGHALQLAVATIIILCSMAFLVAQVETGSQLITLHFPISPGWAGIILLAPVLITVISGGMRSLTIAHLLLVWLIGAALIIPVIWLSFEITGNPIPQLSYGNGALQPILQLEEQLVQINSGELGKEFEQGNFSQLSGFANFFAITFCMMAATSVMPQLYSRIGCSSNVSTRIRTTGWMILFIAVLISALPAFVIFMKFEIYDDLIGLPLNRLENEIGWLVNWANIDGGQLVRVCGRSAVDFQAIVLACGNDSEYVLIPTDLEINPLVTLLGIGEITGMPIIISALLLAGLLSASATTAAILMIVIVNSASECLFLFREKNTVDHFDQITKNIALPLPKIPIAEQKATPVAKHLFVSRLLLLFTASSSIWFAGTLAIPSANLSLWGLLVLAGSIFPVLILVLCWKHATQRGALTGLVCAIVAATYLITSIEYGGDWIYQSGDEKIWVLPFSNVPLNLLNSGIIIIPLTFCIVIAISVADRASSKMWKAREQKHQPIEE